MRSESLSSMYLHIKPTPQSGDYISTKVNIDNITDLNALCTTNGFKYLAKMARDIKYECHTFFMGTGNKFVMDCYNILLFITMSHTVSNLLFFVFS